MSKLSCQYYQQEDPVALSRDLLGKVLCTCIEGYLTEGIITETEAYKGPEDRASHAHGNRRTKRNERMYGAGGISYVYKCYGIHTLFNIVTNKEEIPHAILIRAIHPLTGIDQMCKRRNKEQLHKLASGPGTIAQALGIGMEHNGLALTSTTIWVEDRGILPEKITAGPRIGIAYAGEDAKLPWRFVYAHKANA